MAGLFKRVASGLSERLASTWTLLSDTTYFLSRTSVFAQYEADLMEMRRLLTNSGKNEAVIRDIRQRLVELRVSLRLQGYDLTLGGLELSIQGFRGDASVVEGFRRLVLFIGSKELWTLVGDANHRVLHDYLDSDLNRKRVGDVLAKHYLWYQWRHGLLVVSGSDSESKEDFDRLKAWSELPENRLRLLGAMKRCK
jgi:hypothetical protein